MRVEPLRGAQFHRHRSARRAAGSRDDQRRGFHPLFGFAPNSAAGRPRTANSTPGPGRTGILRRFGFPKPLRSQLLRGAPFRNQRSAMRATGGRSVQGRGFHALFQLAPYIILIAPWLPVRPLRQPPSSKAKQGSCRGGVYGGEGGRATKPMNANRVICETRCRSTEVLFGEGGPHPLHKGRAPISLPNFLSRAVVSFVCHSWALHAKFYV